MLINYRRLAYADSYYLPWYLNLLSNRPYNIPLIAESIKYSTHENLEYKAAELDSKVQHARFLFSSHIQSKISKLHTITVLCRIRYNVYDYTNMQNELPSQWYYYLVSSIFVRSFIFSGASTFGFLPFNFRYSNVGYDLWNFNVIVQRTALFHLYAAWRLPDKLDFKLRWNVRSYLTANTVSVVKLQFMLAILYDLIGRLRV